LRKDTFLTRRQANTIMALCVALIVTQILCTAVLLRGQERARKEAAAAEVSAEAVLEMQKQAKAAANPDADALLETRRQLDEADREFRGAQERLILTRDRLESDGAELEKTQSELRALAARRK